MIFPIVLGFYFLVCISVVAFNCHKALSDKVVRRRFGRHKQRWREWFWRTGHKYPLCAPPVQEKMAQSAAQGLRTNNRLLAFQAAMDELRDSNVELLGRCMPLLADIIRRLLPRYSKRSDMQQAYYAYLVTHFQAMRYAPSNAVTAFLMDQIRQAKSLYNLENALRAIYSSGQVPLVLEALRALDGSGGIFLHEKLLTDGLLTFDDRDALIAALWDVLPQHSVPMQRMLLNYIRFASGAWGEPMLALLEQTDELELKIAALRYFAKYPDERVRALLYELAADPDRAPWELCAVCATSLASYPGGETVSLLKRLLSSRSWYVRYNAALSLRALGVGVESVQDVLTGDDRYAREMLQYRLGLTSEAKAEEVPV